MSKRKNNHYAYRLPNGKQGVTDNWTACERLVSGKPDARYRGFVTREEAEVWLAAGAKYETLKAKRLKLEAGVYFDAGTGRGNGVEISVTDEKGRNLLHKALSKKELNRFGKHLLGQEATNNYGELLAMKYGLEIAGKQDVKKVFGDSRVVIDYWSKWKIKKEVAAETRALAREVVGLRKEFEESGGGVKRISGDNNPADLGFHR